MELARLLKHRADVFLKLPFARSVLNGVNSEFARASYLEHIYRWNGFSERVPRKSGPKDFLAAFSDLCGSVQRSNGLISQGEPVRIDAAGRLAGGSHRMAAYLAGLEALDGFQREVPTEQGTFTAPDWGLGFFVARGVHGEVLRSGLLEELFSPVGSSMRVLVVWPRAMSFLPQIISAVVNHGVLRPYGIKVSTDPEVLRKLVIQTYAGAQWVQNSFSVEGKMAEIGGEAWNHILVIPLSDVAPENVSKLKSELRGVWKNEFQGVHTTDSFRETVELLTTVTGRKELQMLGAIDGTQLLSSITGARAMAEEAERAGFRTDSVMFSGSWAVGALGLREPRDVDVVSLRCAGSQLPNEWSNHHEYLYSFGHNGSEIAIDSTVHSWIAGLKSLGLLPYRQLINSRREKKDLVTLELIDGYLEKARRHNPEVTWVSLSPAASHRSRVFDLPSGPFETSTAGNRWTVGLHDSKSVRSARILSNKGVQSFLWRVTGFIYRLMRLPPRTLKRFFKKLRVL